jgi:hypothetical protein
MGYLKFVVAVSCKIFYQYFGGEPEVLGDRSAEEKNGLQ